MNQDSPLAQFKYVFLAFAGLVAIGPLAMDTYLPAFPTLATYLGTDIATIQYTLVTFLLGSTVGQFLGGPLSDVFGRMRVGLIGSVLFTIASLVIAATSEFEFLLIARAAQGVAAGAAGVVVSALITENYPGKQAAGMMLNVTMVIMGVPLLAPLLGTFLLKAESWRSIFYFLAIYGALISIVVYLNTPKQRLRPVPRERRHLGTGLRIMLGNYRAVFAKPAGVAYIVGMGTNIAVYMVFATSASFAYMEHLGSSLEIFPFLMGANTLSLIIGNRLGSHLLRIYEPHQVCVMGSTVMALSCLLLTLYVTFFEPQLMVVVGLIILISGTIPMSGPIASAVFMQLYNKNAGTASAAMGVARVAFMLTGSFAVTWLHNGTLYPMALLMLVTACAAMVFFRLGSRLVSNTQI